MINIREHKQGKTTRMSFSKNRSTLPLPNLVEIQTESFKWFLEEGLAEVLRDVSPITDFSGNLSIEFVSYSLDTKPKYTVEECIIKLGIQTAWLIGLAVIFVFAQKRATSRVMVQGG